MLSSYTFSHYTMANGLISNEITSIAQDKTGYLWIASNNGLQRFDGVHYKTFQHREEDHLSLPVNSLSQLLLDNNDQLWVLTANGQIGLFDKSKFQYFSVPVFMDRPSSIWALKSLIKDEFGNLFYLLQGQELLQYDKNKKGFYPVRQYIPLKQGMKPTGFVHQPGSQKYWIGLEGGGLAIYNKQTGKLSHPGNNAEQEPAVDSLKSFHSMSNFLFEKNGRFWAVSWFAGHYPHAIQYNGKNKAQQVKTFEFLSKTKTYYEIQGFLEQRDGSIWAKGSNLFSVLEKSLPEFSLVPNDSKTGLGIVYDRVNALFEDREQNIWVATGSYGLYRFNPSQQYFKNVLHLNQKTRLPGKGSILSFIQTKNGDLLVGSWGDGLFRYNSQLKEIPLNIRDRVHHTFAAIWDMCPSADSNTIWMACQPGIFQYDQAKGVMNYRNPATLQNRTVRQIAEDQQGNLWLGMHNFGLYKWISPQNKKDSLIRIPEVGNDLVTKVVADTKGYIWVTTEKKGVFAFHSQTGHIRFHWNNRAAKDSAKILEGFSSVLFYNDSTVIISTSSRLYQFNRNTNKLSPVKLISSFLGVISSLEKDKEGYLWISTTNGLYRFHPDKNILVFFNREDGISNDHFITAASYKSQDGRMLFGADDAFISFDPSRVKLPITNQSVTLTNILAGRKELPVDSVMQLPLLTLDASENSLNLEFSSLSNAAYTIIQYKLDGIDEEWHTADKDNKASFPFLPPGGYTLMLRTINAEGTPSRPTSLRIFIKSPFYQTWWFYTLLAIGVAFMLFWFDKLRMKRKAVLQKVRTDIAGGLHQEVNTALYNINILSEIARLKSDREPHRTKEYLEQIHNKSHNMIIALDDMLWSLDPENDTMDKTISRVKEFTDSLMQRSGASIELLIDKKVERLQLNMKLRHEAFLLFKEGLWSLIDAGTKSCIVHTTAERGKLLFTIEFENDSCNMHKLNNLLHRRDMEDRLYDLRAKLDVHVHKSKSVFLLQLPLD